MLQGAGSFSPVMACSLVAHLLSNDLPEDKRKSPSLLTFSRKLQNGIALGGIWGPLKYVGSNLVAVPICKLQSYQVHFCAAPGGQLFHDRKEGEQPLVHPGL